VRWNATFWNMPSVYFLIADFLERTDLPVEPCQLVIVVPEAEWQWLCKRGLKQEVEKGLSVYANACLRRLKRFLHPFPVDLRAGTRWELFWEPLSPSLPPSPTPSPDAYFVIPNPQGAEWVSWQHPDNPRCPTPEEENADPSQLYDILAQLLPRSPRERRWQSLEERIVCRRRVKFWRRSGGKNDGERVR
jgi:hypothetical protein